MMKILYHEVGYVNAREDETKSTSIGTSTWKIPYSLKGENFCGCQGVATHKILALKFLSYSKIQCSTSKICKFYPPNC